MNDSALLRNKTNPVCRAFLTLVLKYTNSGITSLQSSELTGMGHYLRVLAC